MRDAGDADAIKKLVAVRFFSKQTGFEETVRSRNAPTSARVGLNAHCARVRKRMRARVRGRVRPAEAIASSKAGGSSATWRTTDNMQRATWHAPAGGQSVGWPGERRVQERRDRLPLAAVQAARHAARRNRAEPPALHSHGARGAAHAWTQSTLGLGLQRRTLWTCAPRAPLELCIALFAVARTHACAVARTHACAVAHRLRPRQAQEYGRENNGRE